MTKEQCSSPASNQSGSANLDNDIWVGVASLYAFAPVMPNCPYVFLPNEYIFPSVSRQTAKSPPHCIFVILPNPSTFLGRSKSS